MSKTVATIKLDSANPYDLVRHTWGFRPTTRVVGSKKAYDRKKGKAELRKMMREE